MRTPDMTSEEAHDAEIVGKAVKFAASLFLGRGKFANAEAPSRSEIDALAALLIADNPTVHSKPIITAFDADGNSTVVGRPYKANKPKALRNSKRHDAC